VVIFTKWGGFIEEIYTISREAPHRVLEIQNTTLLQYNSAVTF